MSKVLAIFEKPKETNILRKRLFMYLRIYSIRCDCFYQNKAPHKKTLVVTPG